MLSGSCATDLRTATDVTQQHQELECFGMGGYYPTATQMDLFLSSSAAIGAPCVVPAAGRALLGTVSLLWAQRSGSWVSRAPSPLPLCLGGWERTSTSRGTACAAAFCKHPPSLPQFLVFLLLVPPLTQALCSSPCQPPTWGLLDTDACGQALEEAMSSQAWNWAWILKLTPACEEAAAGENQEPSPDPAAGARPSHWEQPPHTFPASPAEASSCG